MLFKFSNDSKWFKSMSSLHLSFHIAPPAPRKDQNVLDSVGFSRKFYKKNSGSAMIAWL